MAGKTISVKKIYTVCFLVFALTMGIAPVFLFFQNHLPNKTEPKDETTAVSFSELYPFEGANKETPPEKQNDLGPIGKYWNFAHWITDKTEQYLTAFNPLSYPFKNLPKGISDFSQGSIIQNGYDTFIKLPNGYLAGCFDYCPSPEVWANILDFSTWLKQRNIPYVTLITPDKADDSITEFPSFIPHGYTQTLNEYKAFLNENAIQYIESKPVLLAENDDFYSWFYQSDHHWNVHAAFRMACETARVLNDEMNIPTDTDLLDDRHFDLAVYPDSFLGSYGTKLGHSWKEDMEVLYPTTETNFHIEIPGKGIDKTGRFENTLIDQSNLGTTSSYCAFLYGDRPLIRIENWNCHNGTRVLMLKYSCADALCPYLANSVQYLDVIDPRHFDGSIRSYIDQTNPDVVVLCTDVVREEYENDLHLK